jgi:hypothetical protein
MVILGYVDCRILFNMVSGCADRHEFFFYNGGLVRCVKYYISIEAQISL